MSVASPSVSVTARDRWVLLEGAFTTEGLVCNTARVCVSSERGPVRELSIGMINVSSFKYAYKKAYVLIYVHRA